MLGLGYVLKPSNAKQLEACQEALETYEGFANSAKIMQRDLLDAAAIFPKLIDSDSGEFESTSLTSVRDKYESAISEVEDDIDGDEGYLDGVKADKETCLDG